ncbi:MAG: phosphoribosylaminoimidazolesuccinocarboxamide synthase [candidate division Zixibacteria bacterium]|nr:phosphoribosylaminoimidazolesuccinocarboxamide synthase [candidate division Zixibacteria bacterium]
MTDILVRKPDTVIVTQLGDLPLVARGKVRDVYDLGDKLLIVATDRLSAFDVILPTPIPGKGRVLTQMSRFWFERTRDIVPNHLISCDVTQFPQVLQPYREQLDGRSMLVKKCRRIDYECVARGYITGSLFNEYAAVAGKASGGKVSLHGFEFPANLVDSQKLPTPIFTPATKSDTGHDENISFEQMASDLGKELTAQLRDLTIALYKWCADYAAGHGIIIADTKFEFGFDGNTLTLIDEICSPDSSRFWPADQYRPGGSQPSYDKQYVRDYLIRIAWNKQPPAPELPDEVVRNTVAKYEEAQRRLLGA